MAERLKAHAWKVCMRETVSRVRIPPPPPTLASVDVDLAPDQDAMAEADCGSIVIRASANQ